MSFVAFFVVGATKKAGRTGETAIGKTTNYEVAGGVALFQPLPNGLNRGGLVLFGGVSEGSWVIAQHLKAQMPESFSVIDGEEAEFHDETVSMNQSFCLEAF
jgi:hypothetical protein